MAEFDEDGDLLVRRRGQGRAESTEVVLSDVHLSLQRPAEPDEACCTTFQVEGSTPLVLHHRHATPVSHVGLQVWRGTLVLTDYLLGPAAGDFEGCVALELGAGTGLSGLLLARTASRVFLSDVGDAVLQNLQENARANAAASAATRELDWLRLPDWLLHGAEDGHLAVDPSLPFGWQPQDLQRLTGLRCILAADCIYDNDLTEAVMRTAAAVLRWVTRQATGPPPQPPQQQREEAVVLVALERRVCFTLAGMRECAPAYDFWRTTFTAENGSSSGSDGEKPCKTSSSGRQPAQNLTTPPLLGRRIDTGSIPQRVGGYERSEYLELWELRLDPGFRKEPG